MSKLDSLWWKKKACYSRHFDRVLLWLWRSNGLGDILFSSHFARHVYFVEMSMLITLSYYFHNYTCILLHSHMFIGVLLRGASCRCTYDLILMAHFGHIYVLGDCSHLTFCYSYILINTVVFKIFISFILKLSLEWLLPSKWEIIRFISHIMWIGINHSNYFL